MGSGDDSLSHLHNHLCPEEYVDTWVGLGYSEEPDTELGMKLKSVRRQEHSQSLCSAERAVLSQNLKSALKT